MRAALSSRLVCFLLVGAVLAACDHKERVDQNPAAEAWTELSTSMAARVVALRERQAALSARIGRLAVPGGTEDVTLAAAITNLQATLAPLDDAIAKVEATVAQATVDVNAQLAQKDKRAAERTVSAARVDFDAAAVGPEPTMNALEAQTNAAEQIMQRLVASIEAEIAQLRRLATVGGNLDFSAIDFRVGSADLDFSRAASKATLDRLVQFAAACPQLRFGITGHTSKEGVPARNKELSLQRADAVKTYLVAQLVETAKVVRTAGEGSTQTLVDEPEPGTPAEAAMDPATLENLRRRNRRVTIDVVTSCATPVAVDAPVAPTAPTAEQVRAPAVRPTTPPVPR